MSIQYKIQTLFSQALNLTFDDNVCYSESLSQLEYLHSLFWQIYNRSQALNFTFDAVVFDCEGCYYHIVRENLNKFRNVKKIILE